MEQITGSFIDKHTQHDLEDVKLCDKINRILQFYYPKHPWMIGANHETHVIHIQLAYFNRLGQIFPWGVQYYTHKMGGYKQMRKKIMLAGGELLERFNLARKEASEFAEHYASEGGINTENPVCR